MAKSVCLYRRGQVRWIDASDLLINRNTPRGEPADLYERKPFGGRRLLEDDELLGRLVDGAFKISDCTMTPDRYAVISSLGLPISSNLFHNGAVYTTYDKPFKTLKEALEEQ